MSLLQQCTKDLQKYLKEQATNNVTINNSELETRLYFAYKNKYNLALCKQAVNKERNKGYCVTNRYIIDCINSDDVILNTDKEKLLYLLTKYKTEYQHHEQYYKTRLNTLENWLRGLPSHVNIEFMNHNIEQLLIDWGVLLEHSIDNITARKIDRYWYFMAMRINSLWNQHKIEA